MGYRGTTESNMLSCFGSNTFQGRRESLESQQTLPKATVKSQKCAFLGKQKSPQRLRKYTHWSHTQDKLLKKGQGLEANSIPGRQNSQNVSFKFQQKKHISLLLAAGKHKKSLKNYNFLLPKTILIVSDSAANHVTHCHQIGRLGTPTPLCFRLPMQRCNMMMRSGLTVWGSCLLMRARSTGLCNRKNKKTLIGFVWHLKRQAPTTMQS